MARFHARLGSPSGRHAELAADLEGGLALDVANTSQTRVLPRGGRIRRCRVRRVTIGANGRHPIAQVDCLLLGAAQPMRLGTMERARSVCNNCEATAVWRADEE